MVQSPDGGVILIGGRGSKNGWGYISDFLKLKEDRKNWEIMNTLKLKTARDGHVAIPIPSYMANCG